MSDAVIALAQEHKFIRLRRERIRAVEERIRSFEDAYSAVTRDEPLLPILPKPEDVMVQEPFSTLFFDTPLDVSIADSLQAMWIQLPDVASKLREAPNFRTHETDGASGFKTGRPPCPQPSSPAPNAANSTSTPMFWLIAVHSKNLPNHSMMKTGSPMR